MLKRGLQKFFSLVVILVHRMIFGLLATLHITKTMTTAKADSWSQFPLFSKAQGREESNVVHLEHVNLNVPEQRLAKIFYLDGLGCAQDERRRQNFEKGSGTMWINIGTSQFHLPFGEPAQKLAGIIYLTFPDLDELRSKLQTLTAEKKLKGTAFCWHYNGDDKYISVTCPYGNQFQVQEGLRMDHRGDLPCVDGKQSLGSALESIEFPCPRGSVDAISRFYSECLGAYVKADKNEEGERQALIFIGPFQTLLYREVEPHKVPDYDENHIAIYVKDFEKAYTACEKVGAVYTHPRWLDQVDTLEKALDEKQFRIEGIVDESRKIVYKLEHEVRCLSHQACSFNNIQDHSWSI